ncbi:MAG: protein kinase [Myxococcales bacterium]|nr:protein kinase [Myxococcales bacterium]
MKPVEDRNLGSYLVERRLDTGGMAEVFVAKRTGPHGFVKRVALKRILPQYAERPDFVEMFISEARLAAQLEHPNIVQVFDFGDADGELFIAMELVDGTNVNRLLRAAAADGTPLPMDVVLHIIHQAALALCYAHRACGEQGKPLGIVHRDVSPANLLITRGGHIKLGDFGIVRAASEHGTPEPKQLRGKLGYMSPEQVLGRPLDGSSDIFTLAVVFAELLILEPLFGAGSDLEILLRIRDADLRVLHRTTRRIPPDVLDVLRRSLIQEPKDRLDSIQFVQEMARLVRTRGAEAGGAQRLAKQIVRLGLVAATGDYVLPDEPISRPTALVPVEVHGPRESDTARMMSTLNATSPAIYKVRLAEGPDLGPVSFPKLVELITSGIIDSRTLVAKADDSYRNAGEFSEIARFVTSPAFRWDLSEITASTHRGELKGATLLGEVFRLLTKRETGVLHLQHDKRRKKIYFVDGRPEFVVSTDRSELLGEYLIASGWCLRMEVEMALALLPRFGGRLGDALVGLNVMRPIELVRAVTAQVRERYLEAFRWNQGLWAYASGQVSKEEAFPLGHDPHELLRDAVKEVPLSEITDALAFYGKGAVLAPKVPTASLSAFNVRDEWLQVLQSIKAPVPLSSAMEHFTRRWNIEESDAYRAIYFGLACGFLQMDT